MPFYVSFLKKLSIYISQVSKCDFPKTCKSSLFIVLAHGPPDIVEERASLA
jgi:hypothetical protein